MPPEHRFYRHAALAMMLGITLASAGQTSAQWRVVSESPEGAKEPVPVAVVSNDDGDRLAVYRDDEDRVRGIFSIDRGLTAFSPLTCPTYQVDKHRPTSVRFDHEPCRIEPQHALFTLGKLGERDGSAQEFALLMTGTQIVFRYRAEGLGYRESEFSLRGSRQALTRAFEAEDVSFEE